jgi:hypothetical protein
MTPDRLSSNVPSLPSTWSLILPQVSPEFLIWKFQDYSAAWEKSLYVKALKILVQGFQPGTILYSQGQIRQYLKGHF